jgi:tRNA-2-methylthio-N6-dimethylallyladenosine synthase
MRKGENMVACQDDINSQMEYIQRMKELNVGRILKYNVITFGCQMNENDSEKLSGMLIEMGYIEAESTEESDLIIYNTCCVRENAELKVFGHIGALKKLKRQKPDMVIAVCGCMMQQEEVVNHIRKVYKHVDLIFGTHNLYKFPELLFKTVDSNESIIDIWDSHGSIIEGIPIERKNSVKAWVTVMYGCNNFCTYCIVPYVRGRERSRKIQDIVEEVKNLAQEGFKEVTLLGQNVNSYGKDIDDGKDFADLLYNIDKIDGIERIRFMTSHPKDLSERLVFAMRDCRKVCEHLHLPIQAGSTKVLKEMNRAYTKEEYLELVQMVRENIPGIALTTDIIVGFPEESDEDFDDTIDVLEKVRYDSAYTFLYSKRAGTPAAKRARQVDEEVKKKRFNRLLEVQNKISKEINEKLMGVEMEVLVEGLSKNSKNTYTGRTRTNKVVNFPGNKDMIGKLVKVKIDKIQTWSLEGRVINTLKGENNGYN